MQKDHHVSRVQAHSFKCLLPSAIEFINNSIIMKNKLCKQQVFTILLLLFGCCRVVVAQSSDWGNAALLDLSKKDTWDFYDAVSFHFHGDYEQRGKQLIEIFKDEKLSSLNRATAAYYLGMMKMEEGVMVLASSINFEYDGSKDPVHVHTEVGPFPSRHPAKDALINIGIPSIPAVIRNLAESDDAKVRELSLEVIAKIDNDKSISELRLQKAIKAEADSQKQARLQAALQACVQAANN